MAEQRRRSAWWREEFCAVREEMRRLVAQSRELVVANYRQRQERTDAEDEGALRDTALGGSPLEPDHARRSPGPVEEDTLHLSIAQRQHTPQAAKDGEPSRLQRTGYLRHR